MSINLSINLGMPAGVIANRVSYARIDNLAPGASPVFITVPDVVTTPATIAKNIPNGQYQINSVKIYADGRTCDPETQTTPGCDGLISISANVSGNVIVVNYLAPSMAPKVRITVNYPNGGSFVQKYVNDGNPISIGLPPGVFGNYTVSGQAVCDESSDFFSPSSGNVTVPVNNVISGSFQLSNTIGSICTASTTTLYTAGTFVPGDALFTDSLLTNPATGYVYALLNGIIYNLNSSSGVLGANSGQTCGSTATLSIKFLNAGGSFLNFQAILSRPIDAPVTINSVFSDGFSSSNCSGSGVSSAQKLDGMTIPTGTPGISSSPQSTTGSWSSAIKSIVYNVIINSQAVLNGSVINIGSYAVTLDIQNCL